MTRSVGVYGVQRIKQCPCGWFRDLTRDPEERRRKIVHPEYGRTTILGAAELDVRWHKCDDHRAALVKLRNRRIEQMRGTASVA